MTPQAKPTQTIFISSVYEDIRWLVFIEQALRKALPKNSSVEIWSSQRLLPGDNIVKESTRAIERASIALVLISNEFLSSQHIIEAELPQILERSAFGRLRLIPVLVGRCEWRDDAWLRSILMLPIQPLSEIPFRELDDVLAYLAQSIIPLLPLPVHSSDAPNSPAFTLPPPIYLRSITVQNVRCFGSPQTLDFSDGSGGISPWTVILGNNGVGKTTLLRCLASFDNVPNRDAPHDSRLFLTTSEDALVSATVSWGTELGAKSENLTVRTEMRTTGNDPASVSLSNPAHGLICYGYGASRSMAETALSADIAEGHSDTLFSEDAALQNAEEWLVQRDYAALSSNNGQSKASSQLEQVKALLIDVLPDVEAIEIRRPDESRATASVEFKTPYGWVSIRQVSLGYSSLTAWMVDLARRMFERYPNSETPLAEPAIVLVDEIDLHLHPSWQRTLMQFLLKRFPRTQFIVTAHSPLVVQASAKANIALLRKKGDEVEIVNDVLNVEGWRVDQLLTSDLFDLPSPYSAELAPLIDERKRLLSKSRLTAEDRKRLNELKAKIGELPSGQTAEEIELMNTIRQAAQLIKKNGG